jgi:hypothetical protein
MDVERREMDVEGYDEIKLGCSQKNEDYLYEYEYEYRWELDMTMEGYTCSCPAPPR